MKQLPLLAVLLLACSPAQREWRRAKRVNTSEAYRAFIRADPTTPKRAEAMERIERIDFDHAMTRDTSEAWGNYVAFHGSAPRAVEARSRLESARWKEAEEAHTRNGYDLYLASHPLGLHAEEARLRLDEVAWQEATTGGGKDDYARYLVRYRDGSHAEEARSRREEIIWQEAVTSDAPMAYRSYLERFPEGAHLAEARAAVEGFRFSGVAILLVLRSSVRKDSLSTYRSRILQTLGADLQRRRFTVEWLDPIDARGRADLDPFADLLLSVPESHAALVIEVTEKRGRPFTPEGFATDIEATASLVPPARIKPMAIATVEASTGAKISGIGEHALHLDAQRDLGDALRRSSLPFDDWQKFQ